MTKDINVDPGLLRGHAGTIDTVAGDVALAADAAQSVDIHGGAFGILCNFLPPLVGPLEGAVGSAISGAESEISASATGLRGVADIIENQDQESGSGFDGVPV